MWNQYLLPCTQVPFLHRWNRTKNYGFLRTSGKSTFFLWMTKRKTIIQLALCQTEHSILQESLSSASLTAPKPITVCRWRTNSLWKCLYSILAAEPLPRKHSQRSRQICVCLFKFHAWVLGPSSPSWPICSKHGRYWDCSQQRYGPYPEHSAVFKWIGKTGSKLKTEKNYFGVRQFGLLGKTSSPGGISPQARGVQNFFGKLSCPKLKNALQRYLDVVICCGKNIARMTEKLNPFYRLLNAGTPINITLELRDTVDSVNKALSDACEWTFKQPNPGKQLVLMTDASFRSARYALMIEDNLDQKLKSERKTYTPVAFGSKFSPQRIWKCP